LLIDTIDGVDSTQTKSHYPWAPYNQHGWGNPQGLAIDLATGGLSLPIYTSFEETMLFDNSSICWKGGNNNNNRWSWKTIPEGSNDRYYTQGVGDGYMITTYTINAMIIRGHNDYNANATSMLRTLNSYGMQAILFRVNLPTGYNMSNVGNNGRSTGYHSHFEIRPRWRY